MARCENRVLRAGYRVERGVNSLQLHAVVVIEEVRRIGLDVSPLKSLIGEIEAGRKHDLVGRICERIMRLDGRLLFVVARSRYRDGKNSDGQSDTH
jgi:hypothetical protein